MFLSGRKLHQPSFIPRLLDCRKHFGGRIAVKQNLGPGTLRRSPHLQQSLQKLAPFTLLHLLHLSGQLRQRNSLRHRQSLIDHRLERHGPHRRGANIGKALQRAHACRTQPLALEKAIHQQHAPAIRQGVVHRPRQPPLVRRKTHPQPGPLQRQGIDRQLQPLAQRLLTVFKRHQLTPVHRRGCTQATPAPTCSPTVIENIHLFKHGQPLLTSSGHAGG